MKAVKPARAHLQIVAVVKILAGPANMNPRASDSALLL